MKKLMIMTVATACAVAWAKPEFAGLREAKEVTVREGTGHLMEKIKAGKEITIAYLGGSITSMAGWRNKTTDWFAKTYPNAKFKEIHAAIGGTGSNLGVFRVGHDALQYNPDLLFVEFATNDGGAAPEYIWKNMEGIVRQTWKKDPTTDIVFTYTITASMTNEYLKGVCNRAASAMEQLADFYGIPSIGFGPRVIAEVKAGRLVMSRGEIETAVPKETPERDKAIAEMLKKQGKILFANDGTHPAQPGHDFYLASIINGFTQMKDCKPADHKAKLASEFIEGNFEDAKMVPVTEKMMSGSWKVCEDKKHFENRMGKIWVASTPGDKLSFKFRGTFCQIYDLLGPNAGQVWVTVDGKREKKPRPRFDSYCTYHRIATMCVFSGKDGEHTVEIEVDKEQPSRQSVAFRLKDPAKELAAPKFQGTNFWPAQIQIIGDLL